MKSTAVQIECEQATTASVSFKPLFLWLIPLLYPFCFPIISWSIDSVRAGAPLTGAVAFVFAMVWALAGPWAGWQGLNYLDRNGLERREHRLVVYGALFAAVSVPLFNLLGGVLGRFHYAAFKLPAWYLISALIIGASYLPALDSKAASPVFRKIHGYSAMFILLFAAAHVSNHVLAIVSLDTHLAVLRTLRLVYRERIIEIALIAAVSTQAVTGFTMVWKSRFRRTTVWRNLQAMSGICIAVFFASHFHGVFSARSRHVDTTFNWATSAPAGLLAPGGPVGLLPYYMMAVIVLFVHLGCYGQSRLVRSMSEAAARRISYSFMALGGIAAVVIALAACGVHLKS